MPNNADTCIHCGAIIPEGGWFCKNCDGKGRGRYCQHLSVKNAKSQFIESQKKGNRRNIVRTAKRKLTAKNGKTDTERNARRLVKLFAKTKRNRTDDGFILDCDCLVLLIHANLNQAIGRVCSTLNVRMVNIHAQTLKNLKKSLIFGRKTKNKWFEKLLKSIGAVV